MNLDLRFMFQFIDDEIVLRGAHIYILLSRGKKKNIPADPKMIRSFQKILVLIFQNYRKVYLRASHRKCI